MLVAAVSEMLDALADLPRPAVIAAAGLLVLAECTLGLGFLVPGETGLLVASTTARDAWTFVILCLVVTVCAATGDSIGYWLGRRYGVRLRESRLVRRIGLQHWDRAAELLRRHGGGAVFAARFLPVVRTLTPASAGAAGLPYARFLPASISGAACWALLHVSIGAAAGASAEYLERKLGVASWFVFGAIVLAAVVVTIVRKRRSAARERLPEADPAEAVLVGKPAGMAPVSDGPREHTPGEPDDAAPRG
ncbi:DedA family protein [Actinoalloteichus caeruleus]|uniref:DedA family protein n=1 Tax=Actinoalloteichus cyanogriseus TaxID=2893586 RepID=UPI0004A9F8A3|nr:DedA family protein [Actinoalloteichus caeruleus]